MKIGDNDQSSLPWSPSGTGFQFWRPLSEKEVAANEVADWECINDTIILYRNTLREGSTFPTAYTFDKVFRGDCSTKQVYDEGAQQIALSVVNGINSSIFAYGQTSSGKTYTINGITEFTVAEIFDYIHAHEERAFVVKLSAIETMKLLETS